MEPIERARRDRDAVFGVAQEPDQGARDLATAGPDAAEPRRRMFTPFLMEDQQRAATLAEHFAAQANAQPQASDAERLALVMDTARGLADRGEIGLAQHALGLFLTHHPLGQTMSVPSLLKRTAIAAQAAAPLPVETLGSHADGEEAKLDWFREDPLLNEHHEHWHWVYPNRRGEGEPIYKVKERHGELFYYMHQQMLARYDVERIAVGLGKVAAITNYNAPLGHGYDPGQLSQYGFQVRATDSVMVPFREITPDVEAGFREGLDRAIGDRAMKKPDGAIVPLDGHAGSNVLGLTSETTEATVDRAYGNHHGNGHVLIGDLDRNPGVILSPSTAIRDPAFWRWHRHVDDLHFRYQDGLDAHAFDDAPPVDLTGLTVAFERDHPGSDQDGVDLTQSAAAALGGASNVTLETTMRTGAYQLLTGNRYRYEFLTHTPFFVAIRLHNRDAAAKAVTLRLFLIPDQFFDVDADPTTVDGRQMRRFSIELDKVRLDVPSGQQVFGRSGRQMSIIRRPAIVDPVEVVDIDGGQLGGDARTCTCGWPYGLFLPRTTETGMSFKLFAMVTDNDTDKVGSQKRCGSMSFCGVGDEYPDARPMGYPFDRRFGDPFADIVARHPNMMMIPLVIKRVDATAPVAKTSRLSRSEHLTEHSLVAGDIPQIEDCYHCLRTDHARKRHEIQFDTVDKSMQERRFGHYRFETICGLFFRGIEGERNGRHLTCPDVDGRVRDD
ncbi:tyrosinase family protein [Bradyrhizobium sp. AUGA SZCCT0160]|uniref:tyrosinase family protein n=1 Tax=Bradyrhizobium sp. AUGA SZCCT0160 TaxID=2807662 RepID=UPI001BA4FA6F|nr:tyrosinase family protein [Bradyrhizobium sp. AUGA SZCCT0160]MBR1188563.1 tyrosinase family protein [Bradyrhizobium sp. AUGA SZCCT0160]